LAELATRQHGVVSRRQLLALGFRTEAIKSRLGEGRLSSLHEEVYAVGHRRIGIRGEWWSAVLAYGTDAVLSHRTAAALWGLRRARGRIDVTAPTGRQGTRRRERLWIHRCKLDLAERTLRDGIPVTTLARTLFDLSEVAAYEEVKRAAEEADRLKLLRVRELQMVCERGYGRRALRPMRRLLGELGVPSEGRSPLEQRFHAFLREHGLPEPHRNVEVLDHEVDVLWPAAKLIAELDSWEFHAHRAAFERDRARDTRLLLAGYHTIRITHRRIETEPTTLATELHELLKLHAPSP
jgi:very-short-patch-repair endonuclease